MAEEKRSGFCKGTNHILHLLLTLVTFGVWLIFWFGSTVKFGGWRCTQCGSANISNVG
jgi:hypothetical protein